MDQWRKGYLDKTNISSPVSVTFSLSSLNRLHFISHCPCQGQHQSTYQQELRQVVVLPRLYFTLSSLYAKHKMHNTVTLSSFPAFDILIPFYILDTTQIGSSFMAQLLSCSIIERFESVVYAINTKFSLTQLWMLAFCFLGPKQSKLFPILMLKNDLWNCFLALLSSTIKSKILTINSKVQSVGYR